MGRWLVAFVFLLFNIKASAITNPIDVVKTKMMI
jgi:hypothetical protein